MHLDKKFCKQDLDDLFQAKSTNQAKKSRIQFYEKRKHFALFFNGYNVKGMCDNVLLEASFSW